MVQLYTFRIIPASYSFIKIMLVFSKILINDDDVEVMCGVSIAQFGFTGIEATLLNILQVMRKKNQ